MLKFVSGNNKSLLLLFELYFLMNSKRFSCMKMFCLFNFILKVVLLMLFLIVVGFVYVGKN